MSDKKPNASWMFSKKTKDACEERERRRRRREYRLGSDDYTWEEVPVEEFDAEEILDEDEDSRAARPNAAAVAATRRATPPTTKCFDWMFSSVAKNARKKREEEALRGKTEVELVVDEDSVESDDADFQAAILQSIRKNDDDADIQAAILQSMQEEPTEATHVPVQQPEQDLVPKLIEDEAQNVPANTPVNDEDSVAEATIGEDEPTPEIPDDIIGEDESLQRVIIESLQQHLVDAQNAEIAGIKPDEHSESFEESNEGAAPCVHKNKASAEPEPMETSIDKEQRPDGDDIEKDNGDAEKNAPKNEDSSKPESKDVQLEATDVKKACITKSIDDCIDDLLNGQIRAQKTGEGDNSSAIDENDMCDTTDPESLYESDTDGEANRTDEDGAEPSETEEKDVE